MSTPPDVNNPAHTQAATKAEQVVYLTEWASRYRAMLQVNGEVGFGRPCVGIVIAESYPDTDVQYQAGEWWEPEDAYHKHDCLCVLDHGGNEALTQLYQWVRWLDEHGYGITTETRMPANQIDLILHGTQTAKVVKLPAPVAAAGGGGGDPADTPAEVDDCDGIEPPRAETDCACDRMGGQGCPCEADGPDGLCACCREGEHRGRGGFPASGVPAGDRHKDGDQAGGERCPYCDHPYGGVATAAEIDAHLAECPGPEGADEARLPLAESGTS